jgi:hypothetical protein
MTHLSPDQLLDVAEGTSEEPTHLGSCAACRRELEGLRSVMASLDRSDVPEPSPLFWDHLSSRVSEAVEAVGPHSQRAPVVLRRFVFSVAALAAAAALVLAVAVSRRSAPVAAPTSTLALGAAPVPASAGSAGLVPASPDPRPLLVEPDDDQSLSFVADLAHDIDMDPTLATGLTREDAADHAISHLSEGELQELVELLKAELPRKQVS